MKKIGIYPLLWVLVCGGTLLLWGAALYLGELNQDEGWYLYSARLVAEGQRPYVDFATTQGPVLPFIYSWAYPLVNLWGVAGGRLFTALLGLVSVILAGVLAAKLAGSRAAGAASLIAVALVGLNVYQATFFTVVKTYSLTSVWVLLAFCVLAYGGGRKPVLRGLAAGVLVGLAAGTRSSALFVAPSLFIWLLLSASRDGPRSVRIAPAVAFAGGVAVTLLALFLPFWLQARDAVWFAMVEYHGGREAGGLVKALAYKAGFVARLARAYVVPALLLVALVVFRGRQNPSEKCQSSRLSWAAWGAVILVSLVHLLAPFPYDDYQAMVFPLFASVLAAAVAVRFAGFSEGRSRPVVFGRSASVVAIILGCGISVLASPLLEGWFVGPRDRIWWPIKEKPPLVLLRETARKIQALADEGSEILTQDTYLAVESGLRVPRGLEMGPFSYFPEWSREKAEARRVVNRDMLRDIIRESAAPVAAFSGYGLSIQCPSVTPLARPETDGLWDLVRNRYDSAFDVENFGQASTTLHVMRRRE